ncbi:DUF6214 family protein [Streptomyces brasiliensis]|uniref:DUF6214 family protein n=1 Tax=Streptomyces brasiliensis TaxID=1954 RepID=UPI001670BF59|nr:DUF6214 family protein [Streptomyces brasiliensis]
MAVLPAWEVRDHDSATSWFQVCLAFADGARVDALAVVSGGYVSIEDVRAQPAFSLADLTVLAGWIEQPLTEVCGARTAPDEDTEKAEEPENADEFDDVVPHRVRPGWPWGCEGRRLVAREYRAAQGEGRDPVLAVMRATGRSRRRSLRLIARARDAGLLTPRHARR